MTEVHVGRSGWLFLSGGSNEVLRFFNDPDHFKRPLKGWLNLLSRRAAKAASLGIEYRHVLVPDKLSVYPEMATLALPHADLAPSVAVRRAIAVSEDAESLSRVFVDILPDMLEAKREHDVFYKTDAHWNFEGAYVAYQALCRSLGVEPLQELLHAPRLTGDLVLDLGSKLEPPVSEAYVTVLTKNRSRRIHANPMVELKERIGQPDAPGLHVGSNVVFQNDRPVDHRKIVLFGDSFSEYRDHLLTGILAETFAETHFVWSAALDWDYVAAVNPDILVTELTERFMGAVPNDQLDLDRFVSDRVMAFRRSSGIPEDRAPAEPTSSAAAFDLVAAFENLRAHPLGQSDASQPGRLMFCADIDIIKNAHITLLGPDGVLYAGVGGITDSTFRYERGSKETFNVEVRLARTVLARIARSDPSAWFQVVSTASPYPLAAFRGDAWVDGTPSRREVDEASAGLDRTGWDVSSVFHSDGRLHVLGWAMAPKRSPNAFPRIVVDGRGGETFPAPVGAVEDSYWFLPPGELLAFYANAPCEVWNDFAKIEAVTYSLERLAIYNWIGPLDHVDLPDADTLRRIPGLPESPASYLNRGYTDFRRLLDELESCYGALPAGSSVLQFGGDCGRLVRHFLARGCSVTSIDPDPISVAWCARAFAGQAFSSTAEPTRLPGGSFDLLIAQVPSAGGPSHDLERWSDALADLLKVGGVAVLTLGPGPRSFLGGRAFQWDGLRSPDERLRRALSRRFKSVDLRRALLMGGDSLLIAARRRSSPV